MEARNKMEITCSQLHKLLMDWSTKGFNEYLLRKRNKEPDPPIPKIYSDWGHEQEPFAKLAYKAVTGNEIEEFGLIVHPKYPYFGGSPDGLVIGPTVLECKCPYSDFSGKVKPEYVAQISGMCLITGAKVGHLVIYMPKVNQLKVIEIKPDPAYLKTIEYRIGLFHKILSGDWDEAEHVLPRVKCIYEQKQIYP